MSFHRHSPTLLSALAVGLAGAFGGAVDAGQRAMQSLFVGRPMADPSIRGRNRGKGGRHAHVPSGAAAIKRAAQKVRNVRARASKRGAR